MCYDRWVCPPFDSALLWGSPGYPGGIFDPLNFSKDKLMEQQTKEIKNGAPASAIPWSLNPATSLAGYMLVVPVTLVVWI